MINEFDLSQHLKLPDLSKSSSRLLVETQPVAAPRMTQRDKWARRKPVLNYFAFRELLQLNAKLQNFELEDRFFGLFVFAPPESWSNKKKRECIGQPMLKRPDNDNIAKAVIDALKTEDNSVWFTITQKIYGEKGMVLLINF